MTTLDDLYVYYCRQHGCLANSGFRAQLQQLYSANVESRQLQQLTLRANYLGPKGLFPVVDLIRNVHSLELVDISGNGLDNDGATYLVNALVKHPSLVHLDLSRSALHDGCAPDLLRLVKENSRIASLPLSGNNLSASARDKIGAVVEANREKKSAPVNPTQVEDNRSVGLVPARVAPFRAILENEYVSAAESGGSLAFEYTWRRNPQIRLAVSTASRIRIQLTVAEPMATRLVGFALLKTKDARKALVTTRKGSDRDQGAGDGNNATTAFVQRIQHDQAFVPAVFVAETAFSDTSCVLEVDLDKSSTPCDSYVIVPYTFQPGKSFAYKLVAEVPAAINCATVTLEKVPEMDSWLSQEVEGAWCEGSTAGGAIGQSAAWRLNDMIRVTLDTQKTKSEPHRLAASATFFVVVSIQNEEKTQPDNSNKNNIDEDDYVLGCDVLLPESSEFGRGARRPIRADSDTNTRFFSFPHAKSRGNTTIAFAFDRRCNATDVDFFLMPSLLKPGVAKSYRVAVYSNTCVQCSISTAAALSGGDMSDTSWCWKQLPEASWGVETCGGCRADNPTTWINNPCFRVLVPGPEPVDALLIVTTPGPKGGFAFRTSTATPSSIAGPGAATSASSAPFDFMVEVDEASDNCRRLHSSFGGQSGPNGSKWVKSGEAAEVAVWANKLMPGEHWIVPQTRLPGVFASFRVNIFSSSQILLLSGDGSNDDDTASTGVPPLAAILRAKQLARYHDSNAQRAAATAQVQHQIQHQKSQRPTATGAGAGAGSSPATAPTVSAAAAVQHYGATGEMFTDREFPRGPSSLWLNARAMPLLSVRQTATGDVPDFPEVHEWQRLSEMVTTPMFSPIHDHPNAAAVSKHTATAGAISNNSKKNNNQDVNKNPNVKKLYPMQRSIAADDNRNNSGNNSSILSNVGVSVQGVDDSWFISAAATVCSKRSLAMGLVAQHDFQVGIFQFRFFKHGQPQTVSIDDYVPVDGASDLCFARSHHPDDVFFPLLEKAYAKLHRCYEALDAFGTTPPDVRSSNALWDPAATAKQSNGFVGTGLISQALADLTGGIPIERCIFEYSGDGGAAKEFVGDTHSRCGLWRTLLDAHTDSMLVAVRCCERQPRAAEKCAQSGLLMNRLYPVLEAKEAEGVKLVLLLNVWGWESREQAGAGGWRGKWATTRSGDDAATINESSTATWTDARKTAFDTASRPTNSFWVSLDELQYYFGVVHYVDLGTAVTRIRCPISTGGPPESSEWDKNTQFSVNLPPLSPAAAGSVTAASTATVKVIVGLHETDRRLSVNRVEGATVDYIRHRPKLRIAVLLVQQNERRITVLSTDPSECVIMSTKGEQSRDMFYTFDVPLSSLVNSNNNNTNNNNKKALDRFVLMPCFDTAVSPTASPPPPLMDCTLSITFARCAGTAAFGAVGSHVPAPTLRRIEDDKVITIAGEWRGCSAGGPPDYPEWRSNPQYLLFLNSGSDASKKNSSNNNGGASTDADEEMIVTVVLRQRNNTNSTADHIGFCIIDSTQVGARIMKYPTSNGAVVAQATFENSPAVSVSVRLKSVQSRRGLPYVIVPCTSKPGAETGFELSVITNRGAQLKPLASEFDWKVHRMPDQKISVANGSAGGSTKFSSWRNNPQYCVRFPVGRQGRLVVTMIKRGASSYCEEQIGLIAFYGEDFQAGKRKRLSYGAEDVAGIGSSSSGTSAELDITFDCDNTSNINNNRSNSNNSSSSKRGGSATAATASKGFNSLLVMPYSELPYTEVDFTLTFHCTVDITVEKAVEWHQYQHDSAWVAGSSAGGPRHAHGWQANPFFSVAVPCATRIFVLAMQYPHGPEKLVARKVGKQRVYIAPPIVNDHLAVEFGLDLVDSAPASSSSSADNDDDGTGAAAAVSSPSVSLLPVITCSKPTRLHETSVSAVLEHTGKKNQYLVVPYTSAAGIEADFKLLLYSDHPVEFTQLPPADLYRGRTL